MEKQEAEKRIKKLRKEIARLRSEYHEKNTPNVTDEVYDSLGRELKNLLNIYPEFFDPNSEENRIAGKPLDKFSKVNHKHRMLSLNDVFSYEELKDWEKRVRKLLALDSSSPSSNRSDSKRFDLEYFCEIKFDGLAISLIYENGSLVCGATRGDGLVGEDITENLKMINSIPIELRRPGHPISKWASDVHFPKYLEVRGEALLSKKTLEKLNVQNKKEGKTLFANTRNAAAGSLRQLDPKLVQERNLDFVAYDMNLEALPPSGGKASKLELKNHSDKHTLLRNLGFKVESLEAKCKNLGEVENFIEKFSKVRESFPFGTDGVVISVNDLKLQEVLGVVGKAPRGMVAFKYPAERATTTVKDILVNVGRTGVITPLAVFEPTLVAGSTVSKATLHNFDQIERLGIKIGDTVVIEKAGDVILKVVEVLVRMRTGKEKKFKIPTFCPTCGGKIEKKELVAYYCVNPKCPAKNERFIEHFISVFEIYEMGPKILRRFKDEGLITDAADIFILKKEDIAMLERFGEKSAENIVKEIENKKKISLSKFIWSLGILHVGEETARDLAVHFGTLEKLISTARQDLAIEIENIGPVVSRSLYDYFQDKNNLSFIEKLEKNGVIVEDYKQKTSNQKLKGKIFVLTGTLSRMSREIAKEKILNLGGRVSSSVSSNVSFVVVGEEAGSKLEKAENLRLKILSEEEFLKML
jgi:DNA ligase (NAD+)